VKWFNRVIAMIMLGIWLPATSLCLAERAGWISNDDCCASDSEESPASPPSGHSACCLLASGSYKVDDLQLFTTISPIVAEAVLTTWWEFALQPDPSPPLARTWIPPDFPVSWQFSFRAALPPRAPTFVA
jgi:hypothetical protein